MSNLFDYLDWKGDASFREEPLNGVDALCFAELSYADVWENATGERHVTIKETARTHPLPERLPDTLKARYHRLMQAMAETDRFGGITACSYVSILDPKIGIQFAAVCFDVPDGARVVSFRGTDATMVGWREDFSMAYECPVPAQVAAAHYLTLVGQDTEKSLILTGHSKGGNLAAYAAVHAPLEMQAKIQAVWSFDSPGLDDASLASEGYRRIRERMHSVVPEASLIGLLLGRTSQPTIIHSTGTGLYQHDPFTWQLLQPGVWDEADGTTLLSKVAEVSLQEAMRRVEPAQRKAIIEKVFKIAEASGATTTAELRTRLKPAALLAQLRDIDLESGINRVKQRIFGGDQDGNENHGNQ
ncbi:MAG: DUF2974 domain-containing protein [Clostridia bacterium]|nr:DUF2974 domain-containing protein [Clostridia bacterium]